MFASMDLLTYIEDSARLAALAKKLRTDPQYLRQVANKFRGRTCGPKFAIRIEEATDRIVNKSSLRPDIWPSESEQVAA